jgi:hypothetical protein
VSTPLRWPIEGRGCCSVLPRLVFHAGSVAPNPRPRPMPQRGPPSTRIRIKPLDRGRGPVVAILVGPSPVRPSIGFEIALSTRSRRRACLCKYGQLLL